MKKQKVYELTTNSMDGYTKWFVRGIRSDAQARKVAKRGFGKFNANMVSHYSDHPSKYHEKNFWLKHSLTISEFMKKTEDYRR